ncbi:MAG: retroviral-like aspartic protease family protein [Muribaculaceae bacterium]|nr:retroviral-like aspartic protease family protein [Muribaculaceae bacterium]
MRKYLLVYIFLASSLFSFSKDIKEPTSYAYTRGVESFNEKNYSEAMEWFQKEINDNPGNGYASFYISVLNMVNDEFGNALTNIDAALKKIPKKDTHYYPMALNTRSKIYLNLQDTVKALRDLDQAIKIDPTSFSYQTRAELYFDAGNYDLSDADYKKMTEIEPGDAMGYMGLGRNAKMRGNWNDALNFYSYVIKLSPEYSSGYSFRGEANIALEKWADAADDLIKALSIDQDDKAFYHSVNFPKEGLDILLSKLKIQSAKEPQEAYWPFMLGRVNEENKEYEDAIKFYEKGFSLDANSVFPERIANCLADLNKYSKALEYAEKALSMAPDDYDVISLKARLLSGLGRINESLEERNRYLERYPESAQGYLFRAQNLQQADRFKEAVEDYNTAVMLIPALGDYPYLLMRRGDSYRLTGNTEKAKADYERLLQLEKDSVLSSESWTPFAYSGLGNHEKAIETMKFILENDTTDRDGNLYNLACIYARSGDKENAMKFLRESFAVKPERHQLISLDYDLDILNDLPEFKELLEKQLSNLNEPENEEESESFIYETVEVPFSKENGITKVKCEINGLPLHFVFDTGAADVTMSQVEANFMLKNDFIKPTDIIGSARYMDANGDISEGTVINLRNVNFGGLERDNVRASVVRNQRAPLLLGQSVLGRLGKIEIDNPKSKLVITHKVQNNK